jgi:hypothetical protein
LEGVHIVLESVFGPAGEVEAGRQLHAGERTGIATP